MFDEQPEDWDEFDPCNDCRLYEQCDGDYCLIDDELDGDDGDFNLPWTY